MTQSVVLTNTTDVYADSYVTIYSALNIPDKIV